MKIHSKYLNRDFELKGEKITYDELLNIIINDLGVKYKFKIKEIDDHPAVLCTIEGEDRCVHAIGEADEDEKNPTVLASERAFEKAARLYLNIEDIASEEKIEYEEQEEEMEIVSAPIAVEEEKEEEVIVPVEAEVISEVEPEPEPIPEPVPEPTPEEELIPETKAEVFSDPIITIGKYKAEKKTASEVVKTDRSWAEFIVNKMDKNVTGPLLEQINAMKHFMKE